MEEKKLILIGGGGHCRACIDVVESEGLYNIFGILDPKIMVGETILGYPIIGGDEMIKDLATKNFNFLITVGQIGRSVVREKLFKQLESLNAKIITVISNTAYVSKHAKIKSGTIVLHHAIVQAAAAIGANCIINDKVLIEHDAIIEAHCHISTGAIINGGVIVGQGSFIGSGAITKHGIKIKPNAFVKANSLMK